VPVREQSLNSGISTDLPFIYGGISDFGASILHQSSERAAFKHYELYPALIGTASQPASIFHQIIPKLNTPQ
jgi:hypothetical protein